MTPKQFSTSMAPLLAFCNKTLTEEQRNIYFERVKHHDAGVFAEGVKVLIDQVPPGSFIPTIQRINEICRDVVHARNVRPVKVGKHHTHEQEPFNLSDLPQEIKDMMDKLRGKKSF